jgi:hypothetical protein
LAGYKGSAGLDLGWYGSDRSVGSLKRYGMDSAGYGGLAGLDRLWY